jgi:DNA-binding winged helix-turn-helix (wHTH) protein
VNSYPTSSEFEYEQAPSSLASPQLRRYIHFGNFHLDIERRELFNKGLRVRVQKKVIETLLILAESSGQLVTREALRTRLWPGETQMNYDANANVNTAINKLRHVLGDSHEQPAYVETIPRMGYKFIANAEFVEQLPFGNSFRQGYVPGDVSRNPPSPVSKNFFGIPKESWWITARLIFLLAGALFFGATIVLFAHLAQ